MCALASRPKNISAEMARSLELFQSDKSLLCGAGYLMEPTHVIEKTEKDSYARDYLHTTQ